MKMGYGGVLWALAMVSLLPVIASHPQCTDSYPPFEGVDLQFCHQYQDFGCCVAERDAELENVANTAWQSIPDGLEEECWHFLSDILCQECSPYAAHLFNVEGKSREDWLDFPGLCEDYCLEFHEKCQPLVPLLTSNGALLNASAESGEKFCEAQQIEDMDYCYPSVFYDEQFNEEIRAGLIGSGDDCLCLEEFANDLRNPLALTFANDSTHRIYVAEQAGRVTVYLRNGSFLNDPFLDIEDLVYVTGRGGDERGFLGLAFHPDYRDNRKLYVHYVTRIYGVEYVRISELESFPNDTNRADPSTERTLFEVEQPAGNHNGGSLFFGPDGYLYISLGDGGSAGDPHGEYGNGLNLTTFLGKVLRIDVNRREGWLPYGIPADNPFVNEDPEDKFHEIFAYGARNMWRCGVDRGDRESGNGTGRIFCGDVGQNKYEEIDILVKGGNYGWRAKEGFSCYDRDLCTPEFLGDNYVDPIHAYPHSVGKSVTGGYVYRGCLYPHLQGLYIYGDYWNGWLFKLDDSSGEWVNTEICLGTKDICTGDLWNYFPENILSFGEDEAGELYMLVTDSSRSTSRDGKIFRIVDPNKRGNPDECQVDEGPVPIFGPISHFEPSNQDLVDCPNSCPDNFDSLNKKKFCKSYYAFIAKVDGMTNYNAGTRVAISDIRVVRKKSYIRSLKNEDELLLQRQAAICSCPQLEVGHDYFFLGSYRFGSGGTFVIKMSSYVREYHWYTDMRLSRWVNSC